MSPCIAGRKVDNIEIGKDAIKKELPVIPKLPGVYRMLNEKNSDPFFMYVAFTAPHWPLHAWEEDISKYEGKYRKGWSQTRMDRYEEMRGKVLDPKWKLTKEDPATPDWEGIKNKDWEDLRMATYSAQIEQMDRGIGKIIDKLKLLQLGNLFFFICRYVNFQMRNYLEF